MAQIDGASRPSALSPASLAERWDCSSQTIRNLVASGELPAFRLGGKLLRIKMEDIEAFECRTYGIKPQLFSRS